MNRSNDVSFRRRQKIVILIFFIVSLIKLFAAFRRIDSGDFTNYLGAMESDYVSDWHSVLFYKELIMWSNFCDEIAKILCIPNLKEVYWQFQSIATLSHLALFVALCYVLKWMSHSDRNFLWVGLPWMVSFCVTQPTAITQYWGNLESYCFVLLTLIIVILARIKRATVVGKVGLLFLLIICCLHIVDFRRNAWLLMPIITYATAYQIFFSDKVLFKRGLTASLLFMAIVIGSVAIGKIIPHQKMHSTSVMLVSDMKIAAHLLNALEQEECWLADNCGLKYPNRTKYKLRADSENCPSKDNHRDVIGRTLLNDEQWEKLKTRYIRYWWNYPVEMLIARVLSVQHLYYNLDTLNGIKYRIVKSYPHIQYKDFDLPDSPVWESTVPSSLHLTTLVFIIVSMLFYMYILLRNMKMVSVLDRGIFTVFGGTVVYYLSYLVVVPAPFSRYLGTSMLFFWMLIPVVWVRCYNIIHNMKENGHEYETGVV